VCELFAQLYLGPSQDLSFTEVPLQKLCSARVRCVSGSRGTRFDSLLEFRFRIQANVVCWTRHKHLVYKTSKGSPYMLVICCPRAVLEAGKGPDPGQLLTQPSSRSRLQWCRPYLPIVLDATDHLSIPRKPMPQLEGYYCVAQQATTQFLTGRA
jgi:hypothetical protein